MVIEWYQDVCNQLLNAEGPIMFSCSNIDSQDDELQILVKSQQFRHVMTAFLALSQATVDEVAGQGRADSPILSGSELWKALVVRCLEDQKAAQEKKAV